MIEMEVFSVIIVTDTDIYQEIVTDKIIIDKMKTTDKIIIDKMETTDKIIMDKIGEIIHVIIVEEWDIRKESVTKIKHVKDVVNKDIHNKFVEIQYQE